MANIKRRSTAKPKTKSKSLGALSAEMETMKKALKNAQKKLEELGDREAIYACIATYTRGMDRHDWDLVRSIYHVDGVADHNHTVGPVDALIDHQIKQVEGYSSQQHIICNHLCELVGDVAHTETYVITASIRSDRVKVHMGGHRYIDRLEKRKGQWKIALRRVVGDWRGLLDATVNGLPMNIGGAVAPQGKFDRTDISYLRPLKLSAEGKKKFADRYKAA